MTKFRLIKRARGWVVQRHELWAIPPDKMFPDRKDNWVNVATYRFRIFAKLHLTLLREMHRK